MDDVKKYINFLRRRISPKILEHKFQRAIDYVTTRYIDKFGVWSVETERKFVDAVMFVFMDQLHNIFSQNSNEEIPFVEIREYLEQIYLDRILSSFESLYDQ